MTTKTTSAPLDRLTRTEWRDAIAFTIGVAWSGLPTTHQTQIDRIINEAHEKLSQMLGHQPWAIRHYSFSTVASQAEYAVPADFRHMLSIVETGTDSSKERPFIARDASDYANAHDQTDTHPWDVRDKATWFYNGMDDSTPPVQEWKRAPTPTGVFTVETTYRPRFSLLADSGTDQFALLPAELSSSIRHEAASKYFAQTRDFEAANMHRAFRNDDFEALTRNNTDTSEDQLVQGVDSAFNRELS